MVYRKINQIKGMVLSLIEITGGVQVDVFNLKQILHYVVGVNTTCSLAFLAFSGRLTPTMNPLDHVIN